MNLPLPNITPPLETQYITHQSNMPYSEFDPDDFGPNECYVEEIDDYTLLSPQCCICGYGFCLETADFNVNRHCTQIRKGVIAGIRKAHRLEDLSPFMQRGWWVLRQMSESAQHRVMTIKD